MNIVDCGIMMTNIFKWSFESTIGNSNDDRFEFEPNDQQGSLGNANRKIVGFDSNAFLFTREYLTGGG